MSGEDKIVGYMLAGANPDITPLRYLFVPLGAVADAIAELRSAVAELRELGQHPDITADEELVAGLAALDTPDIDLLEAIAERIGDRLVELLP
jgi:hypothetical protein